jgi:hypothetical protein
MELKYTPTKYKMLNKMKLIQIIGFVCVANLTMAQGTEIMYLSGTGSDHTEEWEFYCSDGMNAGQWSTIEVPSCWEQQGFGSYNYGQDTFADRLNETGLYRYNFDIPKEWKTRQVHIVFDGVMTDAEVRINDQLVGPVHQGAFYQFKYDISKHLEYGSDNKLEVMVKKHSDNESVNMAERRADYWIFGGIFRPVFLEVKPKENIERVAIDSRANGEILADVYVQNLKKARKIEVEIRTGSGNIIGEFATLIEGELVRISGSINHPKTWTPEFPHLHLAIFKLIGDDGLVIHEVTEKIGFRTVEVRESDGIYINGVRIKMKGVNRHSFHPRYGRTSSKAISVEVVNLMKDMNMNAVRMSHYPPDDHFLDVCDSLGLFVLDELGGWQEPSYDDKAGRKLLEEMIARDVNHPSVILWDNGNEGGENNNLNDDFYDLDIQRRQVLHPWQDYDKTNTLHYFDYDFLSADGFSKRKIYFPTEILHGLYDGGLGAGLDDYWFRMWNDPLNAGAFLWVFADEALERTDQDGAIDTDGNHAPDGILGPYHEKEASFYTIREIWSPAHFEKRYITPDFDGTFTVENRYHFTQLNQCNFKCEWVRFSGPDEKIHENVIHKEKFEVDLDPGQKGVVQLELPENWTTADVLRISVADPSGRLINSLSWPVKYPDVKAKELIITDHTMKPVIKETECCFLVQAGGLKYLFSKKDGNILEVETSDGIIPLTNGPVNVGMVKKVKQVAHHFEDNDLVIETWFEGDDHYKWTISGDGLVDLDIAYEPENSSQFAGVSFNFPEENISGVKWLGNGPSRVWKNRMKGVRFGLWDKAYNRTITGESDFDYPEFKGYHSEVYWAKIMGNNVPDFTIYIHSKDLFLRILTPDEPGDPVNAGIEFPRGDISFLHGINAIGTKFKTTDLLGPQSSGYYFEATGIDGGKLQMKLTFDFR